MSSKMEQFDDTDWGTLSDSDFEKKRSQVFRVAEQEAREEKLREDSAALKTETEDDGEE